MKVCVCLPRRLTGGHVDAAYWADKPRPFAEHSQAHAWSGHHHTRARRLPAGGLLPRLPQCMCFLLITLSCNDADLAVAAKDKATKRKGRGFTGSSSSSAVAAASPAEDPADTHAQRCERTAGQGWE